MGPSGNAAEALAIKVPSVNLTRCALLVALVVTVSCGQIERARLDNMTGAPITVQLRIKTPAGREAYDELVTLAPGRHVVFIGWRIRNDILPVITKGCTYFYRLSGIELWELNKHYVFPIPFELKPDLTHDLPPYSGDGIDSVPRAKMGFPRPALSRLCA